MIVPCFGRVGGVGCRPAICSRVVSTTGVRVADHVVNSAPDNHPGAGPDGGVIVSGGGCVDCAGCCPSVCSGIVSPAGVKVAKTCVSAPDDHFTAGPDGGVVISGFRRAQSRRGPCVNGAMA